MAEAVRPLDPDFLVDPFPVYAALRRAGQRVVWVPEHGAYWVLQCADVQRLFAEPDHFLQQPADAQQPPAVQLRGIITLDGERHTVVRRAVQEALAVALARAQPAALADAALQRLRGMKQFDAVASFTARVPAQVFWRVFGLPEAQIDACDRLAQTMMRHYGQPRRPGMGDAAVLRDAALRLSLRMALLLLQARVPLLGVGGRFRGTLIGEIARRTALSPTPPRRPSGPRVLGLIEAVTTLVQLVIAGYLSSQFLLGNAVRRLLLPDPRPGRARPWDALAALQRQDTAAFEEALARALEEVRRVDPPVTIVERYTAQALDIGGLHVEANEPVFALVASANRDGDPAEQLEEFHWDRRPAAAHWSLGHGLHECVGKVLQAQVVPQALARLIADAPDLRLCDAQAVPAWVDNLYFRGLQTLPVQRD